MGLSTKPTCETTVDENLLRVLIPVLVRKGNWELGVGRLDAQFGWLPGPAEDAPPVPVVLVEEICKRGGARGAVRR